MLWSNFGRARSATPSKACPSRSAHAATQIDTHSSTSLGAPLRRAGVASASLRTPDSIRCLELVTASKQAPAQGRAGERCR